MRLQKEYALRPRMPRLRSHRVNRSVSGNILIFSVLLVFGAFTALPMYLIVINSLKPLNELLVFPPKFYVITPTAKNFADIWTIMSSSAVPFSKYIFNSFFITAVGTAGQILIGSMCAYPLAKHKFPGHALYFKIIYLSLMFSPAVTAIPSYLIVARLGWIDSYWAIIIPTFGSTMGVYLMKQFMEQIYDSILEAARIDGANEYRIFWSVVMPQVKAAWLTLMVFAVQGLWSTGASPFIYSEKLKTLNYALGQIVTVGIARAGVAAAVMVVMMAVPVTVFLITQSNVMETMASSGVKE